LTTLADARLRRRDQPTFQFNDQPQDCKGAAQKFLCSTNPFCEVAPERHAATELHNARLECDWSDGKTIVSKICPHNAVY
jgi:hypothetical protein